MLGVLPVASSSASHSKTLCSPPPTFTSRAIVGEADEPNLALFGPRSGLGSTCAAVAVLPKTKRTPSFSRAACNATDASASSRGSSREARTKTVTSEPKVAKTCAISRPTAPAPMTTMRVGSSVRLYRVALVRKGTCSMPAIGGSVARPPVATTALRKCSTWPFTSISCSLTKRPRPWNTCAPDAMVPWCESSGAICARSLRKRSITLPKSIVGAAPIMTPNSAERRASRSARALRMSAFDGTHPTLRQSPPARCSLIIAERAPRRAACLELTSPPAPAPMTTRSYSGYGAGSSHP
mmetsp:Transcript_15730/g.34113  ORF Transcript_15730/g.34113 Transcript_15730/m.34113 type:complete len:296 (-) Transcript_15730:132-1019(-)